VKLQTCFHQPLEVTRFRQGRFKKLLLFAGQLPAPRQNQEILLKNWNFGHILISTRERAGWRPQRRAALRARRKRLRTASVGVWVLLAISSIVKPATACRTSTSACGGGNRFKRSRTAWAACRSQSCCSG